eukprot:1161225-Pelagomonas_calceolata.AAC.31
MSCIDKCLPFLLGTVNTSVDAQSIGEGLLFQWFQENKGTIGFDLQPGSLPARPAQLCQPQAKQSMGLESK